ncbi:hypothetical protein EI77_00005 [Prosthecobacter fusiformis]|uniref:YCII-related domain-containing protein n=1 Tax=Prosthecobacter fusiformis TaxID=48464 RepID=A0A4R7SRE0_9BACT|nr:YciI family protein [Prosthecobacter fusiformis]TDU80708.1 hypothetical protein EI77_00005 [Prosthecobacter fusiformis]
MKKHLLKTPLLLLLSLVFTGPAWADPFTLLIYETKADLSARSDPGKAPAYWAAYGAYAQAMTQAGILRGGTALPGKAGVRTVHGMDGRPAAAANPTAGAEGEWELGGYFIIEVADVEAALDWAKKSPGIASGYVEIHPHFINPTMPAQ